MTAKYIMSDYAIADTSNLLSPSLIIFRELVEQNIDQMIRVAGDASRLRPHCKTHKMEAVTKIALARGITKHKCATIAEAEMLATAGVRNIFLAYNLVGPNIARAVALLKKHPDLMLAVTSDATQPLQALSAAALAGNVTVEVLLDVDSGMGRTGIKPGDAAVKLYQTIGSLPGVMQGGLHLYDGQNHQSSLGERTEAVNAVWQLGASFRDELVAAGCEVPRIVAGGTPSFPIFADIDDSAIELSPGTVVLHDAGYGESYPDLKFKPAAVLLTRIVSKPGENRLCLDLGNKAVASDPAAGNRVRFPDLPDARELMHNEEHLVIETDRACDFEVGDALLAIPIHVCPTSALHADVYVVRQGEVEDIWDVTARNRKLTI